MWGLWLYRVILSALASVDLGVHAFVLLGSAGIERTIPNAAALNADRVYVTEARKDSLAVWGRIARRDPTTPSFGATIFGSDGDAKQGLYAVTGHAPILHSPYNDKISANVWANIVSAAQRLLQFRQHQSSFGYLDRKTESLCRCRVNNHPLVPWQVPVIVATLGVF